MGVGSVNEHVDERIRKAVERLVDISSDYLDKHAPRHSGALENEMKQFLTAEFPPFIVVGSSKDYHSIVEQLPDDTNWTKPGTEAQFTEKCFNLILEKAQEVFDNV